MALFSIIIPHYNIPELLIRCLGSIPIHSDFQVIVVDDCSPDADTYKERFPALSRPYLEYYSTPQGGSAGRARNIGLEHAQGEWVICLDADDLFTPEAECLLRRNADNDADILFFQYRSVLSDDLSRPASRNLYQSNFEEYAKTGDDKTLRFRFEAMWGKVFRRSMIEKHHIRCDETSHSNDAMFSVLCGLYAQKVVVFDEPLFLITSREGSLASAQFSAKKRTIKECETRLSVALRIQALLDKHNICYDTLKYKYVAYQFWTDHHNQFWLYFFRNLPRYPRTLWRIAIYYIQNKHGEWQTRLSK